MLRNVIRLAPLAGIVTALLVVQPAAAQECGWCKDRVGPGGQMEHKFVFSPESPEVQCGTFDGGCHAAIEPGGCDTHAACPFYAELAQKLTAAVQEGRLDDAYHAIRSSGGAAVYNSSRSAIQITGCDGRLWANLRVPAEYRELHVERKEHAALGDVVTGSSVTGSPATWLRFAAQF